MSSRRGYAMLTVLWVMTVAAVLAMGAQLAGRDAYDAGRNRVYATRAYWSAMGCAADLQEAIDAELQSSTDLVTQAAIWRTLPDLVTADGSLAGDHCTATLEAAGTRADINAEPDTVLVALFAEAGYSGQAAQMLDSFRDWVDSDSVARPQGAEAAWYAAQGRIGPANKPLSDISELARIRGFETAAPILARVLSTEPGRISLGTAPAPVLAAVPGFTADAVSQVVAAQQAGEPIADLATFAEGLPAGDRDVMAENFDLAARLVTVDPDAWILTATGDAGAPTMRTRVEIRLVRAGSRAISVRKKVNP